MPLEFHFHSTCFKCCLCSRENLCGTCSNWTSEQWKLFTSWQDGTTMSPAQLNVSQVSSTADKNVQRQTVFSSAVKLPVTAACRRMCLFQHTTVRSPPLQSGYAICLHGNPWKFVPFFPVCRVLQSLRGHDFSGAFQVSVA